MICYRDRTFCSFYKDCAEGNDCVRALTKDVEQKSIKIGLGVCQFMEKPECFKETAGGQP